MSQSLIDVVNRYLATQPDGDGFFATPIAGLGILRSAQAMVPNHMVYKPAICLVVQGGKSVLFGEKIFAFEAMQAIVVSIELPALGRVTEASLARPFLGLTIDLDIGVLREVMDELQPPPKPTAGAGLGVFVSDFRGPLGDCVLRLTRLLETPAAVSILHRSILREIGFWLLTGPNGGEICKIALPHGYPRRIANAIHVLRDGYRRAIRMDELAHAAQMSLSAFHQHFKQLTSMTPLQYQKQLRLLEARRLMTEVAVNAETAAYQVGYESASQFSREYSRMFGTPPKRDVSALRAAAA